MRMAGVIVLGLLLGRPRAQQPDVGPIQVFPADHPWNWDISGHNVHPLSATYVASIGAGSEVRADFSFEINVVAGGPTRTVTFTAYPGQSDPGPAFGSPPGGATSEEYRIPASPRIETGADAHCISVDTLNGLLYETYATNLATTPMSAACGAVFDLNSNALRPDGWTSGDAAGLPIFPGLLRYEEIVAGQINHALRVTVPSSQNTYLYPARHQAGSANAALPPMGLRLRLKASKDLSGYTGAARIVMEALKKHGLIVADNGTQWYISATIDDRWASSNINSASAGLRSLRGSDFEAVETVDGSGNPILPGAVPPPAPVSGGGGGGGGGCGLLGIEAFLPVLVLRRRRRT